MTKIITIVIFIISFISCSQTYKNKTLVGEKLVSFNGQSLAGKRVKFPEIVKGKATILLFGYKQQSQFDIDRWLIGLDMKQVKVNVFEIPTIQGFIPRLLKNKIDSGMRKGIPNYLWKIVITVYKDGDRIQAFTGNTNPNNARVMLIDNKAKILYFTDKGFSVKALNELIQKIN